MLRAVLAAACVAASLSFVPAPHHHARARRVSHVARLAPGGADAASSRESKRLADVAAIPSVAEDIANTANNRVSRARRVLNFILKPFRKSEAAAAAPAASRKAAGGDNMLDSLVSTSRDASAAATADVDLFASLKSRIDAGSDAEIEAAAEKRRPKAGPAGGDTGRQEKWGGNSAMLERPSGDDADSDADSADADADADTDTDTAVVDVPPPAPKVKKVRKEMPEMANADDVASLNALFGLGKDSREEE